MAITVLKKKWQDYKQIQIPPLLSIKRDLLAASKELQAQPDIQRLSPQNRKLVQQIQERTADKNKNNVTRTMAYYDFYRKHPEIHWAFLGHMVSRNGGWNMTDLKGDLLSRLLSEKERQQYFDFLERGNWLIFQDVYPQFLLYEASLQRQANLFHLLPYFHVSVFMQAIWDHFWRGRDPYLLAIALVINEQSYLEKRVIQNPKYQDTVLNTIDFHLQDLLNLNQILFPCYQADEKGSAQTLQLIGQSLHHFASLHERIMLGKRLYNLLFTDSHVLYNVVQWAETHSHTGSRKDYWPHVFNNIAESVPGIPYAKRIDDCRLKAGAARLYSPYLEHAWKNVTHADADKGDWYRDWKVIYYLINRHEELDGEISDVYCRTLETIELAIIAKEKVFHLKP